MTKVLMSYRRSDTAGAAGRIFDRLVAKYGDHSIFMDVDNIPFGVDFRNHIKQSLLDSDLMLAIVGARWLGQVENGENRILNETDPVRIEIEAALLAGIPIIPVLIDEAKMPDASMLPESIRDFAYRNAARIDQGRDFRFHFDRLTQTIDQVANEKTRPANAPPLVKPAKAAEPTIAKIPEVKVAEPAKVNVEKTVEIRKASAVSSNGAARTAMLNVRDLKAYYGQVQALHGLEFALNEGSVTTLLGANGAGKTTTLRAICNMVRSTGAIEFDGAPLLGRSTENIVRLGIAHVPQGRGTFTTMTVEENLQLGAITRSDKANVVSDIERMYDHFPVLKQRYTQQAGTLSGGEQQMLAVARALMLRPRLMLLDEPSFGLAPLIVRDLFKILGKINREDKVTILVVEQNAQLALELADKAYVIETGRIVMSGSADEIANNEDVRKSYLGY